MGDMREVFEGLKEYTKQEHLERISKTPDRIEYAIEQFEKNDIKYELKNPGIGHFHCWRKSDGRLFEFWAGTGKIKGFNNRGIYFLISQLNKKVYSQPKDREVVVKVSPGVRDTERILLANDVKFELKNGVSGHFHCWRKSDGGLLQFWSGTGKILGHKCRGIDALIELLKG